MSEKRAIWWIKRDFRLFDNPQLTHALAENKKVLALYIFEPSLINAAETSEFHVNAWINALNHLRKKLQKAGADIIFSKDEVIPTFENLHRKFPFTRIYSHEEIGSDITFDRDKKVANWCQANKIEWKEYMQRGVFRPLKDRDKRSGLWKKFTLSELYPEPDKERLSKMKVSKELKEFALPKRQQIKLSDYNLALSKQVLENLQTVTEADAREDLDSFLNERGVAYSGGISSPNTAFVAGSRLSVHLAWGTMSVRTAYQKTQARIAELKESDDKDSGKWRKSLSAFLSRLHWHDHFTQRLESEPQMEFEALNPAYEQLDYNGGEYFESWYLGKSGFPMSDAVMRCLHQTGFANFRMRAMITSVACHILHINWKTIMYPLARVFADYYPGIHISQIQMQAGVVGINTLRTYNPGKQIYDQDRECIFIKEWIPELRGVEPKRIIKHQEEPIKEYYAPLVDYKTGKANMRAKYFEVKRRPKTKDYAQEVLKKHGSRKFRPKRKTVKKAVAKETS